MTITKGLVCLANSRKHYGRCVAGIDIFDGSNTWIRPVSNRLHNEVSKAEQQYADGTEPQVLDIISVPLVKPLPDVLQRENWLLDPTVRWRKVGRIGWDGLCTLEQRPEGLWVNGYHNYSGTNDHVPVGQKSTVADSLKLIRVDRVTIQVERHWKAGKPPTVRARFRHARSAYALRVTDPVYEERYRAKGLGQYRLGESFLTVSLGEEFNGGFYKLVAAIIERGGRQ